MPNFRITTQPQALYPDGLNDAAVITNSGPSTIYLDSNSSINASTSYPLPPNGVIVWDARRPLWMVSNPGYADVRLIHNGNQAQSIRSHVDTVIYRNTSYLTKTYTELIDVGSYESVEVIMDPGIYNSTAVVDKSIVMRFNWFSEFATDSTTGAIGDELEILAPTTTYKMSARQNVQGRYLALYVQDSQGNTTNRYSVTITASTRQNLLERIQGMRGYGGNAAKWLHNGIESPTETRKFVESYTGISTLFDATYYSCRNAPGGKLDVHVRCGAAVTTAAVLFFQYWNSNTSYDTLTIPVNTAPQNVQKTIRIPPNVPFKMISAPALVTAGTVIISFQFDPKAG